MRTITIYHNPRCSKSRRTLELIRQQGHEPEVVEYLKTPLDATTIEDLLGKLRMEPQQLIRAKEHEALGFPETSDPSELIARMVEHPAIIERPIVVAGRRAVLGRPPENVLAIL